MSGPRAASDEPCAGQVIVPDLFYGLGFQSGSYARNHLIAGVNFPDDTFGSLRKNALIGDNVPSYDAEELAKFERLGKVTHTFVDFVANAVA